jgi:hypothetical protein
MIAVLLFYLLCNTQGLIVLYHMLLALSRGECYFFEKLLFLLFDTNSCFVKRDRKAHIKIPQTVISQPVGFFTQLICVFFML